MQTIKTMFVKLWCHAFVECGFWACIVSSLHIGLCPVHRDLSSMENSVWFKQWCNIWRLVFFYTSFLTCCFLVGTVLGFFLVFFLLVFFRKIFFLGGGWVPLLEARLCWIAFFSEPTPIYFHSFLSVAPLCFQDNVTVVLVWQVFLITMCSCEVFSVH